MFKGDIWRQTDILLSKRGGIGYRVGVVSESSLIKNQYPPLSIGKGLIRHRGR
jgi:hypothetical protein